MIGIGNAPLFVVSLMTGTGFCPEAPGFADVTGSATAGTANGAWFWDIVIARRRLSGVPAIHAPTDEAQNRRTRKSRPPILA